MILKRFYDESLAQASYLIACETTREAVVVDPGLELEEYERAAAAERLRIAHVTDTHIHADYVSGARSLAERLGATLYLSAEGGAGWGYTGAALSSANPLTSGCEIGLGDVRLEGLHTPGHTPEHITFVVTDRHRGAEPVGALTGDFIFVGDVGRPDLLERSAGVTGNAERSALQLYQSVQSFKSRPDHLQIWPGHGAGSACGKSLGALPHTTLGYERLYNWAFEAMSEREFVTRALEHQPVPPRYFSEMKRINRDVVPLPSPQEPAAVRAEDIRAALQRGDTVVDTSPAARFRDAHVPGAINVPLGKSFLTWMGALVPYDRELFLVIEGTAGTAAFVTRQLRKIGLARVAGYAGREVVNEWSRGKAEPDHLDETDVRALGERRKNSSLQVVDVRSPDEWVQGHLPGAIHIPLAALPERLGEIDADKPVVVHCQGGGRSAIAASYMKSHGLRSVANLRGGLDAWLADDLPVERET